ncbi:helix-turn-helix domain-containing protein [Candidatus Woesebacteria bacterium]|nr:helix-turn-helix domain-containing protein [Candidatus Woesebacteria bacterium]
MKHLISLLLKLKTEKEISDFLDGLLTPKEKMELPRRIEIVRMLKAGVPQHQIAETLGVGVATVTRGSKEVQNGKFSMIK